MHNKTISWNDNWILIFICFEGILLFEPSASLSSSFIIASFLIQKLRWIRSSSRVKFFIFLIAWGIFFGWKELDLQLLPPSILELLLLFLESIEINHFLLAHIPHMNEFHDPGRPFKVAITTFAFFTFSFTASSCSLIWETLMTTWSLHSGSSHSSTSFLRSYSDLCSSLQIAWSRIKHL